MEIVPSEPVRLDPSAPESTGLYRYGWGGTGEFDPCEISDTRTFTDDEPVIYEPQGQVLSVNDSTDTTTRGAIRLQDNEPPIVNFSYSPERPAPGETVRFDAEASDPDGEIAEYSWEIENEEGLFVGSGSGPSFEYTFEEVGEYTVELAVTDDNGSTATVSKVVIVLESENEPPTADIDGGNRTVVVGEQVEFESNSTDGDGSVVIHEWRIDGELVGDGDEFTYTFEEADEHTVELTVVDDDDATDTDSVTVTVEETNAPPTAEFEYSPEEPGPGETVRFDAEASDPDGEIADYSWEVEDADGLVVAGGSGPSFEYTVEEVGEYTVVLAVTDDDGSTTTASKVVTALQSDNEPPTADIDSGDRTVGVGGQVEFESNSTDGDGSVVIREWRIDGELVGDGDEFTYTFETPGEHTVELTVVDDDDATDTDSVTVTVEETNAPPTATPTPVTEATTTPTATPPPTATGTLSTEWWHAPVEPLRGETVTLLASEVPNERFTYRWDLDDDGNTEKRGTIVNHRFAETGDHIVTLRVTGTDGDVKQTSRTVSVADRRAPPDEAGRGSPVWHAPVNPQPGETVTFVADPAGSTENVQDYRWDLDGDGSTDARGWAVSHSLGTEGRMAVNLTIEHANGTTETARRTVVVGDPTATPTLTPTSDSGTGENSTFTESATGTDEATEAEGPGFGVSTALFALVILTLLLARRIGR